MATDKQRRLREWFSHPGYNVFVHHLANVAAARCAEIGNSILDDNEKGNIEIAKEDLRNILAAQKMLERVNSPNYNFTETGFSSEITTTIANLT